MEKRLKHIFGLLIVGFGLLFNLSFGDQIIYVDGTTLPLTANGQYANYLYEFNYYTTQAGFLGGSFLGYRKSAYGINTEDYIVNSWNDGSSCGNGTNYGNILFNRSQNVFNGYSGWCASNLTNVSHEYKSMWLNTDVGDGNIELYLGQNGDFGKNLIGISSTSTTIKPYYSLGGGFFNSSFITLSSVQYGDYYRIFFNQNVNLSSPLDGLNLFDGSGPNIKNSVGWEAFYQRGTRTNYGYIVDDGQLYYKFKHFGLFGYGYSYGFLMGSTSISSMSWDSLKFTTVDDSIGDYQKLFGDVSANEFGQFSRHGIMVLRGNSYVSRGNDNGVYLISKDKNNFSRILYEHWSCNTSNLDLIFSGGNGNVGSCVKLDGGYLTYNGEFDIMPFSSSDQFVNASSNGQYQFLSDLIGGGSSLHGYTKLGNNCIYINSDTHCYGFSSNTGVNIREIYLEENPNHGGGGGSTGSGSYNGGGSMSLYYGCLGPVYNTPDGNPPAYCFNENCELDIERLKSCYQVIEYVSGDPIQRTFCEIDGIQQEITFEQVGSGSCVGSGANGSGGYALTPCEGDDCGLNILEWLNIGYSENYFSGFLNNTGWFFKCPFPYSNNLVIWPRLMKYFNGFDIALPINCAIAGYYQGKNVIDSNLSSTFLDSPLLSFEGPNRKMLYMFFDFVLILGFTFFAIKFMKLFKH